jgi:hypothetical protein
MFKILSKNTCYFTLIGRASSTSYWHYVLYFYSRCKISVISTFTSLKEGYECRLFISVPNATRIRGPENQAGALLQLSCSQVRIHPTIFWPCEWTGAATFPPQTFGPTYNINWAWYDICFLWWGGGGCGG